MTMDIKNYYLGTPFHEKSYQYLRIPINLIPQEVIDEYNFLISCATARCKLSTTKPFMDFLKQAFLPTNSYKNYLFCMAMALAP